LTSVGGEDEPPEIFGIDKPYELTSMQFARKLIDKHKMIKCYPDDNTLLWMTWFYNVLKRISKWDSYYEFSDWYSFLFHLYILLLMVLFIFSFLSFFLSLFFVLLLIFFFYLSFKGSITIFASDL
jgi:hypothetical protein